MRQKEGAHTRQARAQCGFGREASCLVPTPESKNISVYRSISSFETEKLRQKSHM